MKILLTGGLGYIGSHIASKLKDKAIILDNQSNSRINYKKKIPFSKVYNLDLNYKNLQKIFSKHSISGVIHLAGLKAVDESTKQPLQYYRNNVYSSLELLESMDKYKIKKFIFSSSATVYGDQHPSPLKENLTLNGINPYASNKISIEQMIKDYAYSNSQFKAICLRYFNPLGADVKKGLTEKPLGKPQNIMPILVRAVKENKIFYIFGDDYDTPDGTCIRDYIHVQDLAEAHLIALRKLSKLKGCESINLGLGKGLSILEFIKLFNKTNRVKIRYKFSKKRKGDVAISFADTKKAKFILNWAPKLTYEDMMRDSWQSFLKNSK